MTDGNEGERIVNDGADNTCFGCSPHNERGLKLAWHRLAPHEVEARYTVDAHWNGSPGVVAWRAP